MMTRLALCISAIVLFVLVCSAAADEEAVESIVNSADPKLRTSLMDFINLQAMQRPVSEPLPDNLEDWEKRRKEIRGQLLNSLGLKPMPPKTPLNPKTVGTVDREGYVIEKIILETRPGFFMPCNLYIPKGVEFPAPAIMYVHGHSETAKAAERIQTMLANLAMKGYIALGIDGVGFGERGHEGHRCQALPLVVGQCVLGLEIWDNIRAIDYLLTRPEVDKDRVGLTGSSGGGLQSTYMAAIEDRISVAMPVDFVTTFRAFIGTLRVHCICNHVPNVMRFADCSDLLSIFAPRPLLIGAGEFDHIFPSDGVRQAYSRVREIYRLYDAEDRVGVYVAPAVHGYLQPKREAAYEWFGKWYGNDSEPQEVSVRQEKKETLDCFEGGEPPVGSESIATLSYKRMFALQPSRRAANRDKDRLREIIREELFGGFPERCPVQPKVRGAAEGEKFTVERILFNPETHLTIAGLFLTPKTGKRPHPVVIWVDPDGKASAAKSAEVARLIDMGFAVMLPDVRGYGESYDPRMHYRDEPEYLAVTDSVFLGRHLLGMRVYDVMRCADYLAERKNLDLENIGVGGRGVGGLIALFAGSLDDRFRWVYTSEMPATLIPDPEWFSGMPPWGYQFGGWEGIPMAAFVPNLMKYADIPDIARLVESPLLIEKLVDGMEKELSAERANYIFRDLSRGLGFLLAVGQETQSADWIRQRMKP